MFKQQHSIYVYLSKKYLKMPLIPEFLLFWRIKPNVKVTGPTNISWKRTPCTAKYFKINVVVEQLVGVTNTFSFLRLLEFQLPFRCHPYKYICTFRNSRESMINLSTDMSIYTGNAIAYCYSYELALQWFILGYSILYKYIQGYISTHVYFYTLYMYVYLLESCKATSQTGIIANPLHTDGCFKCMYFSHSDVSHLRACANRFLIKTANEICKHIVWL